ncbi:MAG: glycosyltransferase family 9 protein [Tepidisphaeraceae bacterium]
MLRRNVLIFHAAALGDFAVTWPIAMALSRLLAQSRVIYVTHPGKGKLAEHAIGCEWRDADAFTGLFAGGAGLPDSSLRLLSAASHVISFLSDGIDGWAQALRSIVPDVVQVYVAARPREPVGIPIAEYHRNQLTTWPALAEGALQMERHLRTRGVATRPAHDGIVRLHPGAGSDAKRWPIERFVELASALQAQKTPVRFVLGEVELEKFSNEDIARLERVAPIDRPSDLVALYELLRTSRGYVGHDTGPTHLAAMAGTPSVALFGPASLPAMWSPMGPKVATMVTGDWATLGVDAVVAKLREAIG